MRVFDSNIFDDVISCVRCVLSVPGVLFNRDSSLEVLDGIVVCI